MTRPALSPWPLALLGLDALVGAFLARNFAFVPMWIEGLAEYEDVLLTMLGFERAVPACWVRVGKAALPLALAANSGAMPFYLDAPAAWLWFTGRVGTPYVYRFTGIVLFLGMSWLFYGILRAFYRPPLAFAGAAAFLTTPNLLLFTLTDRQAFHGLLFFMLLTALLFVRYLVGGRAWLLVLAALALGLTLNTRIEAVIWPVAALAVYLALARPPLVLERWRRTRRKPLVLLGVLVAIPLGALPLIAFNVVCPDRGLLAMLQSTVLPNSLNTAALPLEARLGLRLGQVWEYTILNSWSFFEINVPNVAGGLLWLVGAGLLVARSIRTRRVHFLLVAFLTTIPLSIFVIGGMRPEHLTTLQPAAVALLVAGLAVPLAWPRGVVFTRLALGTLIVANVATSAANWWGWTHQPPMAQTMLNQSDPELLAAYLRRRHANDAIYYTNIGLASYMQYLTLGRLVGADATAWSGPDEFTRTIEQALARRGRRRVFVAVGLQRDGQAGALPRTRALLDLLDRHHVAYRTTTLASERNPALYDIIVVERGQGIAAAPPPVEWPGRA